MSYSRWSNSVWYTFWIGTTGSGKGSQFMNINCTMQLSYDLLKESTLESISKIKYISGYSDKEIKELFGYMQEFVADIDRMDNEDHSLFN